MDAKQVWRAALGELQVSLSPANFETWLKDTELVEIDENRYRISAPNGFARDWLDNRYRPLISQTLARVVGGSVQLEFIVADASGPLPTQVDEEAQVQMPPLSAGGNAINLNSRYTFNNFIVGSANRLAHAAAPSARGTLTTRSSCTAASDSARRTSCTPSATPCRPSSRASGSCTPPARSSPTTSSTPSASRRWRTSAADIGASTSSSSTTSSSSPTASGPRRSSSTPSTPSTRPASRWCSVRTGRPRPSPPSRSASAAGSSGASSP